MSPARGDQESNAREVFVKVLYVEPGGPVASGTLWLEAGVRCDGEPVLLSGTGHPLAPNDVRKILVPARLTEDDQSVLWRATRAGYRVEDA